MKFQYIVSSKAFGIALLLISFAASLGFVFFTNQRWAFKALTAQGDHQIAEGERILQGAIPSPTSTFTPEPLPSATSAPEPPSPEENPVPVTGFSESYILEVLHIEGGTQTLIKIYFPGEMGGELYAEIEALWSTYLYTCTFLDEVEDTLFCFGRKLPATNQASIELFHVAEEGKDPELIFSAGFVVPVLIPTPTDPPASVSSPIPAPTNTFVPTITPTPSITPTPTSTNTPKPTRTPRPTKTPRERDLQ